MFNNLIRLYRDPTMAIMGLLGGGGGSGGGQGGGMAAGLGQAVGLAQTAVGFVDKFTSKAKMKRLMAQRRAFQTPQEVYDLLHATQNRASQGYDPATLEFLTGQIDRTFSSSAGASMRLGGDPNDVYSLFEQKIQSIMKVGADSHALNMENFSKYLNAVQLVAQNKEAEWASKENILKDKIQAVGADIANANKNIQSGLNAVIGSQAAYEQGNLYGNNGDAGGNGNTSGRSPYVNGGASVSRTSSVNPNATGVVDRTLTIPSWLLNPIR
jgi:hypothetical protein